MTAPLIVDLSSNNPHPIDYRAVKNAGVAAVILKATQGIGYTSPVFAEDVAGFAAVGMPAIAYHWADFTSPAAEAAHFLAVAGWRARVLDSETNQDAAWQQAFLTALNEPSDMEMDYGSASTLPRGVRALLWPASYGKSPGFGTDWQYTSSGRIAGISGEVDLSTWLGSLADFDALFGIETPTPPTGITLPLEATSPMTSDVFHFIFRDQWATKRSDNMGAYVHADGAAPVIGTDLMWFAFNLPTSQGGFGGSMDLALAWLIDDATAKEKLRPEFVGSV